MKLNLTDSELSLLGNANLEAFFDHMDFLIENPDAIKDIPNNATVIFQTGDPWVDTQNQLLAEQSEAEGSVVHRVIVPLKKKQESSAYSDKSLEVIATPKVVKESGAEYEQHEQENQ